ncbi:MAG: hypothetical protein J0H78_18930 [Rhizobiales bacterium]|nr:hypothetical protein [Hyphomicrobiales bacterium]OJY44265.1 MAG: hypothetical protein BGP08_08680 [Rhizobiales bacterium 64-17]
MLPVWDGENWSHWIDGPDGRLIQIKIMDAAHSLYLTKTVAARESDLWIPIIEIVWQRLSYPELVPFLSAIEDDFHLLAASAAKLEHLHSTRAGADEGLMASFVRSEIEYMLVVTRSIFDLLQEVISRFWNDSVKLLNESDQALKKRNRMPTTFAKVAFASDKPQNAAALIAKYALPPLVAAQYEKHAPFFASLRVSRDRIIHGNSSVGHIFVTDKGFAVSPQSRPYGSFPWTKEHYYNDNIVSLMPWISRVVFQTLEACTEIIHSFGSTIQFPDEIAPGYRVLLRDPANGALLRLHEAAQGKRVWWNPVATT